MEFKHIQPAYSPSGFISDRRKKITSAVENFVFRMKKFGKKFSRNNSDERFSPGESSRLRDRKDSGIRNKLNKFNISKGSILKWSAVTVISVSILVFGARALSSDSQENSNDQSSRVEVKGARATQQIGREFRFPLSDGEEDVSELVYTIEKVELRDEILVQGQKATAIEGRTFLIISVKLTNEFTQPIEIDTRDFIRLSVNGNEEEWLAPDIHNDPVEVQAISTKYTRLGFAINVSDKDLVLRVGEITGDKEFVELEL